MKTESLTHFTFSNFYKEILFIISFTFLLTNCDKPDGGRNDQIIKFYFKGQLLNEITGKPVIGMSVTCFMNEGRLEESIDTSKNSSYLVFYSHNTDPHTKRLSDAFITAYNSDYYGDTIINKALFKSTPPLLINILVKPVGFAKLTLHGLTNVQNVVLNIFDGYNISTSEPYNERIIEFAPTGIDTTVILPVHPGFINGIICFFNKSTSSESVSHSSALVSSGDTVLIDIYH
jgi:hypothetical protein